MRITMNDDETLLVEWDENDPIESQFNEWTEEEWVKAIEEMVAREWESDEYVTPEFDDPLS